MRCQSIFAEQIATASRIIKQSCQRCLSPDLNPIEQVFAKLKALLRKIAARTAPTLWDALGDLLECFTPQECVNYLANADYVHPIGTCSTSLHAKPRLT
jgi:hypothetical protein